MLVWNETTVELLLDASTDEEFASAIDVAASLWADQSMWADRIEQAVTEWAIDPDLDWIDDADAFARSLTPLRFYVDADGSFEVWHDDGLVDSGHAMVVEGTLATGLTDVKFGG